MADSGQSSSRPAFAKTFAGPSEPEVARTPMGEPGVSETTEKRRRQRRRPFFVAVHVGAGYHAPVNDEAYISAMNRACAAAAEVLSQTSGRSLDAVSAAIKMLEDEVLTNAGRGSNLTECGSVECDASVMDGLTGAFGSVGAAPGILNPIKVAELLAKESLAGQLPLGRIPPIFLAGDGARAWALRHGLSASRYPVGDELGLTTPRSRRDWRRYVNMIQSAGTSRALQRSPNDEGIRDTSTDETVEQEKSTETTEADDKAEKSSEDDDILDTVGALCVDADGNIVAGASSGGIAMKAKGRVGLAAMYGCGCWAKSQLLSNGSSIGCTVTGAGEHIIRALAARECCILAQNSETGPSEACRGFFQNLPTDGQFGGKNDAGVLLVQARSSSQDPAARLKLDAVELVAAFTAQSFGIGFRGSSMKAPENPGYRPIWCLRECLADVAAARREHSLLDISTDRCQAGFQQFQFPRVNMKEN